ncbi:MAG: Fur family transcriptional regulator [Bacillota bacterium]
MTDREHRELLHRHGLKATPQRLAVLKALSETVAHPTAETVHRAVQPLRPGTSLATVYNVLNLLAREGLIMELTMADAASRFDYTVQPHAHIVCTGCGRVADIQVPVPAEAGSQAESVSGFRVDKVRLEFRGLCPDCLR